MFNRELMKMNHLNIGNKAFHKAIHHFIGLLLVYTLKEWLNCV
ncbi:hypothetical protein [Acinetobacter calcoaceticus]|nr:hypothetical protein [Acinetobacter calcoaceticus]